MRPMVAGAGAGGVHLMEKQSLVPTVQELWNAWEIHFLILLSLFLQVFLFLFAGMRQRSSWWLLRLVLWLAYLSADSVAVFVLGHLAVQAGEPGHQLMAFWAPFLLVHLGGQDTITAFSKQDNELYWRHLLNLVTQVAVAGYVVAKTSWSDGRLMAAMVLIFLCGCLKYVERILSLYIAGPSNLSVGSEFALAGRLKQMQHERGKSGLAIWKEKMEARKKMEETLSMMSEGSGPGTANKLFLVAEELIYEIISATTPLNQAHNITATIADDLPPVMLMEFLHREDRHNAYEHVGEVLGLCYQLLYTKAMIREVFFQVIGKGSIIPTYTCCNFFLLLFYLLLAIFSCVSTSIALALFMVTEKGDQRFHHANNKVDIVVSYVLLVGAIVLDVSSATILIISYFSNCTKPAWCNKQWSQELGQYNMINSADMSCAQQLFGYDVTYTPITEDHTSIKGFILDTLLLSGKEKAWNIASTRGQQALHSRLPADHARKALEMTITSSVNFPTSVLIWHIATDICYYKCTSNSEQVEKHKQISRELSNYIMYLVYNCRVMLTTSSKLVHDNTKGEVKRYLSQFPKDHLGREKDATMKLFEIEMKHEGMGGKPSVQKKMKHKESGKQKDLMDEVQTGQATNNNNSSHNHLKKLQQSSQHLNSPVLPRACAVAQKLIDIEDAAARWDLIAAVWAEMLYYIAPRCGGGFHYEHLSTGGEFVTHVLVLMYYLGPFLPPPDA